MGQAEWGRSIARAIRALGAALNHPNILALYDIGPHESAPYLVMALFETRAGAEFPYDMSAEGQRFLIISAADDASADGITVVVNGTAA